MDASWITLLPATRMQRPNRTQEQLKCTKLIHGPLVRYVKLWVAHAPTMLGMFSPPPRVSDPNKDHGTCVTHVPWCMPGSLTNGFLWSRWRAKHSRRMRNPQFYISGKRPIIKHFDVWDICDILNFSIKFPSYECHLTIIYFQENISWGAI